MTLKQCADDVALSLDQQTKALNIDDQQIRTHINWSRRELCIKLLPFMPEWFLQVGQTFTDGDDLQPNQIGSRLVRAIVSGVDARYAKPSEFFKVPLSTVNPAIASQPIFTLWKNKIWTSPSALGGTYDYYQGLADLATDGTADATDLGIPTAMEPAVTLGAIYRLLYKLNQKDKLAQAYKDFQSATAALTTQPAAMQKANKLRLESIPVQQ